MSLLYRMGFGFSRKKSCELYLFAAVACRKSMFFQKKCLSLIPNPKPLPRGEGLCMLCWLCIVQSLCAYTPGIRAGLNVGLPPLDQARMLAVSHTKPLHDAVAQMADDLYGGYAPKQGRFGCLPKVLHDAKPTKQATLDTPFLIMIEVFRQPEAANYICSQLMSIHTSPHLFCSFSLSFINPTKLSGLITLSQGPKDNTRITISVSSVA